MNAPLRRDGVYVSKAIGKHKITIKYRACITVNGRKIHLGYFDDELSAIKAREDAESEYFICKHFPNDHRFTKEDYLYLFRYEKESGRLINEVTRPNGALRGLYADNTYDCGYRSITLQGKHIKAHRVIWTMLNEDIKEGYVIDHINRIRYDNRIENIRLVTMKENMKNVGRRIDCKFVTGVFFVERDNVWRADIGVNNRRIFLGEFKNKNDAAMARKEAETKYGFIGDR